MNLNQKNAIPWYSQLICTVRRFRNSRAGKVKDLTPHDTVIVGASVHMARIPGETKRFVRRYRETLVGKRVACFIVCLAVTDETEESRTAADGYIQNLRHLAPEVEPLGEGALSRGASWPIPPTGYSPDRRRRPTHRDVFRTRDA
ncbi:MAG: flavodoxin domain-containing protein [Alkalispirochaeta sp.]